MAETYIPIATTTLSAPAASITFSSIPSTYTDLRVSIVGATSDTTADSWNLQMNFNGDTATNYSVTRIQGNGTTVASARNASLGFGLVGYALPGISTSVWGFSTVDIFGYSGSAYKTALCTTSQDLNGSGWVMRLVDLWRSTAAITSIAFTVGSSLNFRTGTVATLYGIKAA